MRNCDFISRRCWRRSGRGSKMSQRSHLEACPGRVYWIRVGHDNAPLGQCAQVCAFDCFLNSYGVTGRQWLVIPLVLLTGLLTAIMPVLYFALYREEGAMQFPTPLRKVAVLAAVALVMAMAHFELARCVVSLLRTFPIFCYWSQCLESRAGPYPPIELIAPPGWWKTSPRWDGLAIVVRAAKRVWRLEPGAPTFVAQCLT